MGRSPGRGNAVTKASTAQQPSEKLTTKAMQELVDGDLNYKLIRRRRSEA